MASVTSWTRLEPIPRTSDLESSLRAPVADPLWLLARQRQTLEFQGEDAGSPIVARISADSSRLSRLALGVGGEGKVAYSDLAAPLEATIESEQFEIGGSERLRVEAGLHFLRLLAAHRASTMRARYREHYRFVPADDRVGGKATGFRTMATGRAPDGAKLFADLAAHRGRKKSLTSLPDTPNVPTSASVKVMAAANEWLVWYESLITSHGERGAWDPRHLEYSFAVAADATADHVVLAADEYADGHLDWHTFRRREDESFDGGGPAPKVEQIVRTVIPTPASYSGMPADRFWQFEDSDVSFGSVDVGPTDLTRLVLMEFALVYGNDWFVVPIDLSVGSLCTIKSLEIVDTFGVTTMVKQVAAGDDWAMFEIAGASRSAEHPSPFFLPPTLASTIEGDPIESVVFLRDEMANMVWGVEQVVQGPTGDTIDRREAGGDPGLGLQQIEGDVADAELIYRLATPVPDHWIPFVPVPDGNGAGVILERRTMRRSTPTGSIDIAPLGRILEPGRPLQVEEVEVPREGIIVERSYQLARWTDGSTHLWLGRRKRVGRGEGRSGLRFDVADRAEPTA